MVLIIIIADIITANVIINIIVDRWENDSFWKREPHD